VPPAGPRPPAPAPDAAQTAFLTRLKQSPPSASAPGGTERLVLSSGGAPSPPAPGDAEGPLVPGYEVVSILGRGGMGVVYLARHVGLNRLVALKMILAGPHARASELERF